MSISEGKQSNDFLVKVTFKLILTMGKGGRLGMFVRQSGTFELPAFTILPSLDLEDIFDVKSNEFDKLDVSDKFQDVKFSAVEEFCKTNRTIYYNIEFI